MNQVAAPPPPKAPTPWLRRITGAVFVGWSIMTFLRPPLPPASTPEAETGRLVGRIIMLTLFIVGIYLLRSRPRPSSK